MLRRRCPFWALFQLDRRAPSRLHELLPWHWKASQEVAVVRTSDEGRSLSMLSWSLIPS